MRIFGVCYFNKKKKKKRNVVRYVLVVSRNANVLRLQKLLYQLSLIAHKP